MHRHDFALIPGLILALVLPAAAVTLHVPSDDAAWGGVKARFR